MTTLIEYAARGVVLPMDPTHYVKAVDRLRRGYISTFTKTFKVAFKREQRALFKNVTDKTVEGAEWQIIANVDRYYDFTFQYEQLYGEVLPVLAEREFDRLQPSKTMGSGYDLKSDAAHVAAWERQALQFVANDMGSMITAVEAFSHTVVVLHTRVIARLAIKNGWSVARFATELKAQLDTLDFFRAIRIARTEVMTAASMGTHTGAIDTGLKLIKTWLTVPGQGERHGEDPIYAGLNGQVRKMGQLFNLGNGSRSQMPHAINLPGKDRINCVCTHFMVPV